MHRFQRFRLVRDTKDSFESLHQCSNPVQIVCVTKSNLIEHISTKRLYNVHVSKLMSPVIYGTAFAVVEGSNWLGTQKTDFSLCTSVQIQC